VTRFLVNRWLGWALLVPIVLLIAVSAIQLHLVDNNPDASSLLVAGQTMSHVRSVNDFDLFYLVGRLYREGDILASYDANYLLDAQQHFLGIKSFLPWTYPPQFTAFVTILPVFHIGLAFFLFVGGTLAFFVATLRRLDWRYAGAALLAVYPPLILNARLGQNGFLTAGLIGLVLVAYRDGRGGGLPLGILAIKPHLGAVWGLLQLLDRRWKTVAVTLGVIVITCAAATLELGLKVWPAFFAGVEQSSGFLENGSYSLYRMASVYGTFRSFGVSASTSFLIHGLVAVLAIGLVLFAYFRRWPLNRLLALTAIANLFISPYNHDYDYVPLAFAVVLILPEVLERISLWELACFYVLAWIGGGAGLAQHLRAVLTTGSLKHPIGTSLDWSFQALGVIGAFMVVFWVLRRPPTTSRSSTPLINPQPRASGVDQQGERPVA
jgi:hypothetical protein